MEPIEATNRAGKSTAVGRPKPVPIGAPGPAATTQALWRFAHATRSVASARSGPAVVNRNLLLLERVMNSIRNALGMRETEMARELRRPWNPHFYAVFAQVHNTL